MVRGNKEARKHLARLERQTLDSEPIMFLGIVICGCSGHALSFKTLFFRSFVTQKEILRDYFT